MNEFKGHTPGPWLWYRYPDGRKLLIGKDNAVIHCPDAPMTCSEADQALIVAAPLLLAQRDAMRDALQAIMDEFDAGSLVRNTDGDGFPDWSIRATKPLAALAKARAALARTDAPKE